MAKGANKRRFPTPPVEMTQAQKREWKRVCEAVEAVGHAIREADRSLLAAYIRAWTVNQAAFEKIESDGSVVKFPNGATGISPYFKVFKETSQLLRAILADLGATPAARDFDHKTSSQPDDPGELPI